MNQAALLHIPKLQHHHSNASHLSKVAGPLKSLKFCLCSAPEEEEEEEEEEERQEQYSKVHSDGNKKSAGIER